MRNKGLVVSLIFAISCAGCFAPRNPHWFHGGDYQNQGSCPRGSRGVGDPDMTTACFELKCHERCHPTNRGCLEDVAYLQGRCKIEKEKMRAAIARAREQGEQDELKTPDRVLEIVEEKEDSSPK